MSVRRWASQDLVLAAFCVAAITLGLWPDEPTRQMIHSLDRDGNTSSYSLSLQDSRLARLSREIDRLHNPPPTREIVLAKWRMDLAGHYARRLDSIARPETSAPENTTLGTKNSAPDAISAADSPAGGTPIVQVGFSLPPNSLASDQTPQASQTGSAAVVARELAFWNGVSQKSQIALESANQHIAQQIAKMGPPAIVLGEVFQPAKSANAWITAILLGLLTSCLFADWQMRSPAIVITRSDVSRDTPNTQPDAKDLAVRIQIPIEWIRIHQPASVLARRATLALLLIAAIAVQFAAQSR